MNRIIKIIFLIIITNSCQKKVEIKESKIDLKSQWVDSIYENMTLKEKVGQLFMVATYSNRDSTHINSIKSLIQNHHLGGLCFFQNSAIKQAELTNQYQEIAKIPLLISIDAEWGLSMRLDSTFRYPYNMTLGAVQNNDLIMQIGKQIGKHCKRLGIHVNFAPVVDINTNPKNPIIGVRSYGENKINVADKAVAFTQGMQSESVMACAKHFPGHGDSAKDSHKTLPTISFDAQRIDSVELYPFKKVFENGMASVMVAHLNVPSLESTDGLPSSLSYTITTKLLKEKLNYNGLIFTDALNMKGAADYKKPGDVDLAAFKAGNDVLVFTENAPKGISKIIEAYNNNEITEERLSHSVKKILRSKYEVNLNNYKPIETTNLIQDLNSDEDKYLYNTVIKEAITVIKNEDAVLPLVETSKKIAYLNFGDGSNKEFLTALYQQIEVTKLENNSLDKTLNELKEYDLVIIGFHQRNFRKIRQFNNEELQWIEKISKNNKVILDVFASQYCLANLSLDNIESLVVSYENTKEAQQASADIILGITDAKGKLPASINNEFKVGLGLEINTQQHN